MGISIGDIILGITTYCSALFSSFVVLHGLISALLARMHSCSSPVKSRFHRTKAIIRLSPVVIFYFLFFIIGDDTDPVYVIKVNIWGVLSIIAYTKSFFVEKTQETENEDDL